MIAAHLAGMPLEEVLPSLGGPAAGLLMVRAWMAVSRRRRGDRDR